MLKDLFVVLIHNDNQCTYSATVGRIGSGGFCGRSNIFTMTTHHSYCVACDGNYWELKNGDDSYNSYGDVQMELNWCLDGDGNVY
jgi:hypothetical protein